MINNVRLFSPAALAAFGAFVACPGMHAATIAHWSFDAPTITTDANGILTAADSTNVHNATTQLGGAGVFITPVAGQFGQAAQFGNANANGQAQATNNAWMSFPQLTEIAGTVGRRLHRIGLGQRARSSELGFQHDSWGLGQCRGKHTSLYLLV